MKAQGRGVILLNASKGAFAPTVDNAAYASSKAAVAALCRNLAAELGPSGIRVNCLNADFVDTPLMRSLIERRAALSGISVEAQEEEYRRRNLLHVGPIPTSAVAEAALFLVSSRSRFTTGTAVPIDGGIKEAMPRYGSLSRVNGAARHTALRPGLLCSPVTARPGSTRR